MSFSPFSIFLCAHPLCHFADAEFLMSFLFFSLTRLDPPHAPIRFRRRLLLHHGPHHTLQHCQDHWARDDWESVEGEDLILPKGF